MHPTSHYSTWYWFYTAVPRRVIGPGTDVPAATLYLSSSDTLTTPPHRYVDSDLHRFPSLGRGLRTFQYFLALLLYVLRFEWLLTPWFSPSYRGCSVLVVLWPPLTPYRRIAPQRFHALVGSLRIRRAAFTQCKPNLPCALLTEYRAQASIAASPRALWPSIRFLFILSVFRLWLPSHPTLLWRSRPWLFDSALSAAHWGLPPQLRVMPDVPHQ